MTTRTIQALISSVAKCAAQHCSDLQMAEQLQNMTAHWLRRTNATHRLMAGASLEATQDELGYADIRTTRTYAKTSSVARKKDAEKLAKCQEIQKI